MKKFLFIGMAMLMFVLTACNKESEKNILGSWRLVHQQEIYDDSEYGYEMEDYIFNGDNEKCYFLFQKNGVLYMGHYGEWTSWEYLEQSNEIKIAGRLTYRIEKFSHKEMVLSYTYTESDPEDDYWYSYSERLYFEREKAPKGYGENVE